MSLDLNDEVIKMLIGVVGTLTGALLTWIGRSIYEHFPLLPLSRKIRQDLQGNWSGTLRQKVGRNNETAKIHGTINLGFRKKVCGTAVVEYDRDGKKENVQFELAGGMIRERFLKMDYFNAAKRDRHFGAFVLRLNDNGDELQGVSAGYGDWAQETVTARIELKKDKSAT